MTCRAQHLGPYLESQGHSATLQPNRVRPIFVILNRISKISHRNDHHFETMCRAQIWVATLKVKVTI